MAHHSEYFLGHSSVEQRRLQQQAGELGEETARLFVYGPDHSRRPILLQFANNLRDRLVAEALIGEEEFADCVSALEHHLSSPETFVVSHLFIQGCGRKP